MAGKTLLRVNAPAKINLSLRVTGTRSDGFHELRTIFQSIDLCDTLTFQHVPGPFALTCNLPALACDETNLAWRAAEAIARAAGGAGAPRDITIRLQKRIPMQSGLGGGSSNAAAVLRGFATLWGVTIPRDRLRQIAAPLGADVAYFLDGGTSLGLGKGDLLFPLVDQPGAWVALVFHPFGVSTRDAYAWFDAADAARSDYPAHPSLIETGNDLQAPVASRHPAIEATIVELRRAGASYAALSGSGSAVFGLFSTRAAAVRAARACRRAGGRRALVTTLLSRARYRGLAGF
jgi:4-diphosphocytidyl-2-C-methyl-D-erythritol kinase